MKTLIFILLLPVFAAIPVDSQQIVTAERYLEMVSEQYSGIRDYEANVIIRSGNNSMPGNLSYRSPYFLRIDFTRPANQVIVFNGELLTVYLPEQRVVLSQVITPSRRSGTIGHGLGLLRRNYLPSYVSGPAPVPLESGSTEQVVKLRLTRRNVTEGFRELILSINPNTRMIRRVEGRTAADGSIQMDFTNLRTNQGIPDQRFLYDPPAGVLMQHNFLFRE
ncbi:MAG: outer-membrane lipoprotein carrier protein LolA [Treponema sp.]|nr:outer-membrane lipoprotein carrier protein LolA [Treponema sp.]